LNEKQRTPKRPKNNAPQKRHPAEPTPTNESGSIHLGNVKKSTGIAIGTNAKATVIQIGSLFDLNVIKTAFITHWKIIAVTIISQGAIFLFWLRYKDRFLLPIWILVSSFFLIEVFLLALYLPKENAVKKTVSLFLSCISFLLLSGTISLEYQRVIHPSKFDPEVFGVAVAQFGEGPDFENTNKSREVSELVLGKLLQEKQERPNLQFIQFRQIGLVTNESEADEEGRRIGADLVIWGQLQINDVATTLNFSILETPDKVSNPTLPRVVPLIETSANGIIQIPSRNTDEIAAGTSTISAFTFGLANYFQWDYAQSNLAFEEALETSLSQSNKYLYLLHLYYGLSLQWPGELEAANEHFRIANTLIPDEPAAPLAMAFGNRSLGNMDEARANAQTAYDLLTSYIRLHPENAIAYYNRALANEILEDSVLALKDYQTAVEKEPQLFIAYIGEIRMNLSIDRIEEAIDASRDAIELAEGNGANPAWAYFYLAQCYERNNDISNAKFAYQKAVSLAPQIDWIHFHTGQFYERNNEFDAAKSEYEALIKVSSNKPWAHSILARLYAEKDLLEDAIREYELALQIDPQIDGLWIELANVYVSAAKNEEANQAFRRAIAVAKKPSNLIYNLFIYGNFLYTQGEIQKAIGEWEKAYALDPNQCDLMLNLGTGYKEINEKVKAIEMYEQILLLDNNENADCILDANIQLKELRSPP
jgi:tetratricopeptide (TPR) repeat protein